MSIDRCQFLKIASAVGLSKLFPSFIRNPDKINQNTAIINIIILVLDAFSAKNIKRFADRAAVYHNHFA